MTNETINVDVNINQDGFNQIPQLTSSIDALKESIGNLNKALSNYNEQNQQSVNWGIKVKSSIKETSESFKMFKEILTGLSKNLGSWGDILSGIFTLITTYGPDIIDFFGELFQSDKVKASAQALKDYRDMMKGFVENVAQDISKAEMLLNVANDKKNQSLASRAEAISQLNKLAPDYLEHLTLQNLETDKGKKMVDEYIKSLKRKALEESAQVNRASYVQQRYALKESLDIAAKNVLDYKHGDKKDEPYPTTDGVPGNLGGTVRIVSKRKEAYDYYFWLLKQDEKLVNSIKNIDGKLANELKKYQKNNTEEPPKIATGKKAKSSAPRPAEQHLTAQALTFAQTIELDKQNYDKELALLNEQLAKKLITQQQYDEQRQALQEQHHLAIGNRIKTFSQNDLENAKRHMEDMVEAQRLAEYAIPQDEKDVKKAILPGQKFEAEKQLITDKYNYEIAMADGNSQKIKELTAQREQDITQLTKQYEQQRTEFAMQSAQKVSDTAFSILKNNIKAGSDAKIKDLESQKQAELSNKSLTANQRKAIEDKYKKKEAEEKTKAFKAEQRASMLQAVINGALAITKATSQTGVLAPFVIPGIIVETAIQVATIAAQKAPQYAKGGLHFKSDGRGAVLSGYSRTDDTNAYLRSGEAVVVSEAMRNPWARNLVSAINVAYGGRDFSVSNPGKGYAIGGIFTDGGNANRYYSQPANDVKDLANTLAYQMINNFPPIYVDVKDVNNQQNILAQTVNRVNL